MGFFGNIGHFIKSEAGKAEKLVSKGVKGAEKFGKEALKTGEGAVTGVLSEAEKLAPEALQIAGAVADPEAALAGVLGGAPQLGGAPEPQGAPPVGAVPQSIVEPAPEPAAAIEVSAEAKAEVSEAQTKKAVADETSETIQKLSKDAADKEQLKSIKKQFPGSDPISLAMRAALSQQAMT